MIRTFRTLALLLGVLVAPAAAQPAAAASAPAAPRTQRVEVDFDDVISGRLSLDEVKRQAIDAALAEAVRQVVGTKIEGTQQAVSGEGLEGRFLTVALSSAAGKVVDYRVVSEGIVSVPDVDGRPVSRYRGRVSALVAEEVGRPDPSFSVGLSMNRPSFVVPASGDGEEMIATVTATQDAFVTLFIVTEDTVQVVLPSVYAQDNRIAKGTPLQFPSARQRAMSMTLSAYLPPGRDRAHEVMVAVATKRAVPFGGDTRRRVEDRRVVPTVNGTINQLQEWLVRIPLDERAVAYAAYDIRRAQR